MDPQSYAALRERAAWIDLSGRGKIRATGEDRARLLHSMTTNHIQELMPGSGCYTFFLTAQGRIIADANIFEKKITGAKRSALECGPQGTIDEQCRMMGTGFKVSEKPLAHQIAWKLKSGDP